MKPFQFPSSVISRISWTRLSTTALVTLLVVICCGISSTSQAADEPKASPDEPKPAADTPEGSPEEKPAVEGLEEPDEKPLEVKDESDSIDPTNKDALAWSMSGQKSLKRGDLEAASEAFEKAAAADPKSAVPVRALAMVFFRMGKAEEGNSTAEKAMRLDPDDYQTRLEMAVLRGSARQFDNASKLLEEALTSKTLDKQSLDFVHIHQVRAAVLLEMRKIGEAANSYEIILQALERPEDFKLNEREHKTLLKNRLTSYEVTGRILLESGRIPKAIQAFEALSRTEKDAPGDHNLLLARAYFQQDKLDACEQNLNRYFETGRRSAESLLLLRDLFEASSRSDSLTTRLQELTEDAADVAAVKMFLGQILLDQGKTTEAAEVSAAKTANCCCTA